MSDNPELVRVGWYCWRCEGLVEKPCRSDNVPVSVPADWADDMLAEIRRLDEEPDDEPPAYDGPSIAECAEADAKHWPERQWTDSAEA